MNWDLSFRESAVYDTQNSSEYGTNENPPIIAIYTSHHKDGLEQQSIAYSNDKGRHFENVISEIRSIRKTREFPIS